MRTLSGAWKRRWKPGRRQRRQRGKARTKSRQYYRRNRSKILRKQRQRRRRPSWKNNPARKRSEKLRRRQNRRRRAELLDPALVALRFAEQRYSPANQRGGEDNKAQRKQTPSEAREDHLWYLKNRSRILPKAKRRYKTKCKPNAKCMDRREKYRERPEYYKRKPPQAGRTASVLTLPEIGFVIGPDMVLGFVDSLSPLTGMVTFRLDASNVSQIASMPVEVFLRAVTFLSDEDTQAFFDLVDVEIGLEAYEDLDEEGLRECAGLYDIDPDAEDFKEKCFELVGEGDISKMTVGALEEVNDVLVMGILEDGGEPRSDEDASENDEDIPDEYDPHLFYGEVEISKTAASVTKWTAANMLHEYVHDMEYGSQRVLGKRGSGWLISYRTYDGEEKQVLVGGHEDRSGRVFLSVRSVGNRLAGDILLYDQGNPSNNEIKQPGEDVSYEATSPSHYRKSPDDKHGVPPGHALLDRDYNNTPPATSRVVPDSMGETLREQLTYVQASARRVASRWASALTPAERSAAKVVENALGDCSNSRMCWISTEVLYHLLGGAKKGYRTEVVEHEGWDHWFLRTPRGAVIDLTTAQFQDPNIPYARGAERPGGSPATLSTSVHADRLIASNPELAQRFREAEQEALREYARAYRKRFENL